MKLLTPRGLRRAAIIATAALLASSALAGCSAASGPQKGGQIVVGVAMKTQQERRWAFDVAAMQAEAKKQNIKLIVQWANNDADTQTSQIENLLSQGVKALIITPVDSKAVAPAAAEAEKEGVPVISYDVGIQGTKISYEVIRDNPQVGVLQAEAALKFAPTGNYALIEGDAGNDVAQAIAASHKKVLAGKGPKVVFDQFTTNWDPSTALNVAETQLSSNNDNIKAFLTANDGMAASAVQAVQARGLGGKVFISGLDGNPQNLKYIDEGLQTMTVWTQIDKQGKIAVDVAAKLARGQKVAADTTVDNGSKSKIPARVAPVVSITKSNLCDFVNKIAPKGWVTAADAFDNPSDCPAN